MAWFSNPRYFWICQDVFFSCVTNIIWICCKKKMLLQGWSHGLLLSGIWVTESFQNGNDDSESFSWLNATDTSQVESNQTITATRKWRTQLSAYPGGPSPPLTQGNTHGMGSSWGYWGYWGYWGWGVPWSWPWAWAPPQKGSRLEWPVCGESVATAENPWGMTHDLCFACPSLKNAVEGWSTLHHH